MTKDDLMKMMKSSGIKTQGLIYSEDVISKLAPLVCRKPTRADLVLMIRRIQCRPCEHCASKLADAILTTLEGGEI